MAPSPRDRRAGGWRAGRARRDQPLLRAYGESKQALFALPREKADAAAYRIEQHVRGTDVTKKGEGTGLGLALTQRFVDLDGGRLWLESTLGEESTFTKIRLGWQGCSRHRRRSLGAK